MDDVAAVAAKLTPVPRDALLRMGASPMGWQEIVAKGRSWQMTGLPLLSRNLITQVQESRWDADTSDFVPALYIVSEHGIALRAHLTSEPKS